MGLPARKLHGLAHFRVITGEIALERPHRAVEPTTNRRAGERCAMPYKVRTLFDSDVDSLLTHTADLFGACPTCSAGPTGR